MDSQLHEKLGYIIGKVEAIDAKLTEQNGSIKDMQKTVAKHDIIFGKIGVVVTAVLFVMTIGVNFLTDMIKGRYLK